MLTQLILGAALISAAVGLQAGAIGIAAIVQARIQRRAERPRGLPMVGLLIGVTLWMLAGQMAGVFIWATAFWWTGALPGFEPAVYFALTAYTTLGYGDILLPNEWRLLGGLAAANGMISFGLATAYMVRFLTAVRTRR